MKNFNKNYLLIVVVIIVILFLGFNFYTSKCTGEDCLDKNLKIQDSYSTYKEMNPKKIKEQLQNKEIFLLDVREEMEWNEGHIEGAVLIPLGNLNINSVSDLPKEKPIYVYCRSGRRAGEAEKILKSIGFKNVLNIGGINTWKERGGVLIK